MKQIIFPAEWHQQQCIQLTWPHKDSDWAYLLNEVEKCFVQLALEIASRQSLLIVAPNVDKVRAQLPE
ncbi:MAG: agmatine deiminase family protein, partial [Prolixibacteraceae bacterium]|nr:agmatine deiminase family protein [Prolixibacteraceae bacterium]